MFFHCFTKVAKIKKFRINLFFFLWNFLIFAGRQAISFELSTYPPLRIYCVVCIHSIILLFHSFIRYLFLLCVGLVALLQFMDMRFGFRELQMCYQKRWFNISFVLKILLMLSLLYLNLLPLFANHYLMLIK